MNPEYSGKYDQNGFRLFNKLEKKAKVLHDRLDKCHLASHGDFKFVHNRKKYKSLDHIMDVVKDLDKKLAVKWDIYMEDMSPETYNSEAGRILRQRHR
jgi:hypothetical protein